jgi:hypothetical protein
MILIGMPGIDQRFRHYPQFHSRLGFSHHYRTLGRDELLFVLDRHWKRLGKTLDPDDFTNAQARDFCRLMAAFCCCSVAGSVGAITRSFACSAMPRGEDDQDSFE